MTSQVSDYYFRILVQVKLSKDEYTALSEKLEKNRKIFRDIDQFIDFTSWNLRYISKHLNID